MYPLSNTVARQAFFAILVAMIAVSTVFAASAPGDPQKEILDQVNKVAPTAEQLDDFRDIFREYYRQRNDASRRILRTGGDVAIKVEMKLRKITEESIKSMSVVLTDKQLDNYRELLRIANVQFLESAGLN